MVIQGDSPTLHYEIRQYQAVDRPHVPTYYVDDQASDLTTIDTDNDFWSIEVRECNESLSNLPNLNLSYWMEHEQPVASVSLSSAMR